MMIIKDSINLPVTPKAQSIHPKLESQCRNIRQEFNQLSIKSTCVMMSCCLIFKNTQMAIQVEGKQHLDNVDRAEPLQKFCLKSQRGSCLDKRRSPKLEISCGVADREQQAVELGGQPLEQYNVDIWCFFKN